jgi:hypothetical protein
MLEVNEHFVKQTSRNRCYILTAQGKDALSVPLTNKHGKTLIRDVRIDYSQKWMNNHWRTIQSAYGKAPFFEHYAGDLHGVLYSRVEFLCELNLNLLTMCLKWLRWEKEISETLAYQKQYLTRLSDLRSCINPKETASIAKFYKAIPYLQVFGNAFAENLSIIDLIFCCGPEASRILRASRAVQ